ncbi:hypothetical protein CUT44_03580 [Streptomyces carminius]|uniref:Uncharacterized protein n=1 Tax=Streptomyces carminius TaxID=2665496 RepID=A0A2M8M5W4_9ACTN|nr:hypothetical protein [Streptomyces carminius]PJE99601.1 hypothetical protein CUT44_03580 [Streptomyces carminius]
MGYVLEAVVAREEPLRAAAAGIAAARTVPLRQGLALLPMTDELFGVLSPGGTAGPEARPPGFRKLPGGFDRTLTRWSATGPVAYAEADFFGGDGEQRAAVWDAGALVLGPLHTAEGDPFPAAGSPLSQALRRLGAVCDAESFDEFAAVGLGRHRHTRDWAGPAR